MELPHNNVSDALARHAATDAGVQRQSRIAGERQARKTEPLTTRLKKNKKINQKFQLQTAISQSRGTKGMGGVNDTVGLGSLVCAQTTAASDCGQQRSRTVRH